MKIVVPLLCGLLWTSCGPTTTRYTSSQIDSLEPTNLTIALKKTESDGIPSWYVHFDWNHPIIYFDTDHSYLCGHLFEREIQQDAQAAPAEYTARACHSRGEGWEEGEAEVYDHWWGTTREFHVRLESDEGRYEVASAPSRTVTLTFPPMPAEYILGKMHIRHDATCFTPTTITSQAECIRQVLTWEGGACRRSTVLPDIINAITPYSPDTLAETLNTLGVSPSRTLCYSMIFPENNYECGNNIDGYFTRRFPGETWESRTPFCLTSTRLDTILDVYAAQPSAVSQLSH